MAKTAGAPDDYDDLTTHLAERAWDILAGWVLVCCLALGIVLGFWHHPPLRFGPESFVQEGAELDPPGLPFVQQEGAPLANDLGMTQGPAK
jgi:hypothetical protein